MNQKPLKVEYLMKLSQYLGKDLQKGSQKVTQKTFFVKVSKIFAEFK